VIESGTRLEGLYTNCAAGRIGEQADGTAIGPRVGGLTAIAHPSRSSELGRLNTYAVVPHGAEQDGQPGGARYGGEHHEDDQGGEEVDLRVEGHPAAGTRESVWIRCQV
jgi:hypothetical protein